MNEIEIVFSKNVTVTESDLQVVGVNNASYSFSGFSYNATTFTATWTLASPLPDDKVMLELDGSDSSGVNAGGLLLDGAWTNGVSTYPSGNGAAGSNFDFEIDVLPGDVDGSGGVNFGDYLKVNSQVGYTTTTSGYNFRYDLLGQGTITSADTKAILALLGDTSPSANPSLVTTGGSGATGGLRRWRGFTLDGPGSAASRSAAAAGPAAASAPTPAAPAARPARRLKRRSPPRNMTATSSDTITLGDYDYRVNDFTIQNLSNVSDKVIYIQGVGAGQTLIDGGGLDRIFIVKDGIHVIFQNLTVEKGVAHEDGLVGSATAGGGAFLIDGGTVSLSFVSVKSNIAVGLSAPTARPATRATTATMAATAATRRAAAFTWRPVRSTSSTQRSRAMRPLAAKAVTAAMPDPRQTRPATARRKTAAMAATPRRARRPTDRPEPQAPMASRVTTAMMAVRATTATTALT